MNGEIDPNIVTPGPAGAFVVLALFIATFFIIRSFLKHLKRVQGRDDDQE